MAQQKLAAQTPQTQPLVQPSDVKYLGTLRLPSGVGNPNGLGVAGDLMYVATYGGGTTGIAVVRVPASGLGTATLVAGTKPLPNTIAVHRGGTYNDIICGGILPLADGSIVASGWTYYDGGGGQIRSHWSGPSPSALAGPFTMEVSDVGMYSAGPVGARMQTRRGISDAEQAELDKAPPESFDLEPRASKSARESGQTLGPLAVSWYRSSMVGGYMGHVPPEWQALFGGSALTGQCAIPIIFRTSLGPCASVFDPAKVGAGEPIPSKMLVGYPYEHPTLGKWEASPPGQFYGASDQLGSVAFPPGTRSVLFTGRHGDTNCYGPATNQQALVGTMCNPTSAYKCCFDPFDAMQGNHGAPYRPSMWAYDANDLLLVKQGTKKPWEVAPYARFDLPGLALDQPYYLRAGWFDPATMRYYVGDTGSPIIHVFQITVGTPPPPPPPPGNVNCLESAGAWSPWSTCDANNTRTRTRVWTTTTAKQGTGTACAFTGSGAVGGTATETASEACTPPPPVTPLSVTAQVLDTTGSSPGVTIPVGTKLTITVK